LQNLSGLALDLNGIPSWRRSLVFLAQYSPALNPIEQVFAKLKAFPRNAATRTCDAVLCAVARTLATFPPGERADYFRHSGYAST
jgi:transposase